MWSWEEENTMFTYSAIFQYILLKQFVCFSSSSTFWALCFSAAEGPSDLFWVLFSAAFL